ncbi:MAG: DsbE family thiol:disulfide interchange protein [Paracoccaceae bacterium]
MSRVLMILPPVLFLGLAAMFWIGMQRGDQPLPSAIAGGAAPAVAVVALGEGPVTSDAVLRAPGVKLVNFWASWCAPCRAEHAFLKALAEEGVVIHGINYKDKPSHALGFLEELGNPFATMGADDGRTALDWGVYGVPETYVIDSAGKVIVRLAGPITAQEMERTIRPALLAAE